MFPKMGFDKVYVGVLVLRPPGMPRTERQMQGPVCKSPEHHKYRVVVDAKDKAQRLSSEPAKAPQLLTSQIQLNKVRHRLHLQSEKSPSNRKRTNQLL